MKTNREPTALQIGAHDLNAFVDGVLDDDRRVDLFAHLAANPADAEKVNGYFRQQALLDELRDALSADDDDQFLPELQRRIDRSVTRQHLFILGRRLAASLAVLAPLAAAGWWTLHDVEEPLVAEVSALSSIDSSPAFPFGGHFAPIEARAIDEGVASLATLARYLDNHALSVPDLGTLGLTLIGGEAINDVHPPAARLIYMDESGNRLLVYIAVVEGDGKQAVTLVPEGHLALNWRNGPLVFAVVGPAGSAKLFDVMRSVSIGVTEMAVAPPGGLVPAVAGKTALGTVEADVRPVAMPDGGATVDGKTPTILPADKVSDPSGLTPVSLETAQPKV